MTAVAAGPRHAINSEGGADKVRRDRLATAIVGFGSAVVFTVVTLLSRGTIVALWGGLVTLCVTPGCAVVCWHSTQDHLTRVLKVLAASITWTILVTTVLAWRQATSLGVLITVTAGVGGFGSAVFLIDQAITGVDEHQNASEWNRSGVNPHPRLPAASRRSSSPMVLLIIALMAAAGLWAAAVIEVRGHAVGTYGLLPLLGVPFLAAVALTVGVLVLALWFVRTAWPAVVVSLGLLAAELNGTQKIVAVTPLTSWAYKHFGVVDYLVHGGALSDPHDLYQQWPGFFAAAAGLVRLSGRSPLAYANWTELFFQALNAVTLFAIAQRFSRRHKIIPYVTVLLYLTVNWEGQIYYSPQTMAFLLALLFQLFLLPLLEPERLRWPFKNRRWLKTAPLDIPGEEKIDAFGRTARSIGLIALFGAITITHQLSPYIVFAGVAALWVLGMLRQPVLVLVLMAFLVIYPALHLTVIDQNPMLNGFDISNTTGVKGFAVASPAQVLGSDLAKIVCLGIWGGTTVCALSYRRRLGIVLIPLVMAAMPLSLVLVSSYGGEGIYRAFLFSSPWCALVITTRLADLVRAPKLRLASVGLWALFAALASAQAAEFGQYPVLQVPQGEITASAYFLDHAPLNATLMLAASNFPSRVNGKYVLHNATESPNDPALDTYPQFEGNKLDLMSPKELALSVGSLTKSPGYLVIAPSMYPYEDYYETFTSGTLPNLVQRLKESNYWRVWYQNDGTVIFQALPQGKSAEKTAVKRMGSRKRAA